ncbi:pyridoxamine 5'-phosphate oxidase family protein [Candidatus Cetobacterium colombiensis]|uniref:Pyridoxamine 5'-phosphate oxidase family protein n=1 Tax=Candidatus Cetobacterium colombiensis TaxID=3073100 RepID=A0ABU4W7F4_9FUSO|nr:pyridoxamine 5'-phosphate oxidase family protein [Candidatus Cetobacterium colombiensis]MDX8335457.1 pyridoxamine 5'-phosphate oxidase family protein [Candidatus Cetobacterium colombiensis]
MMMQIKFDKDQIKKEVKEFKSMFKSVVLGTQSKEGEVDVTYAPYLEYAGNDYIYISEIGDHFDNLKDNPNFEIMFLQDENDVASVLVRKRLRYNVIAEFKERDDEFDTILDAFEEKIGDGMKVVRKMQDFHLVKLNILNGRFVKGFGQAYNLKDGEIIQMTGDKKSHR